MLYVLQVGIINPGDVAPQNSIEAVIWVAVGGRGAPHGAILVNLAKTILTESSSASFPAAPSRASPR